MNDYSFTNDDFTSSESMEEKFVSEKTTKAKSAFDRFKEELNRPAVLESTKAFRVEGREGLSVEYSTELDYDILQKYIQRHTKKNVVNALSLMYDILTFLNRGFRVYGEQVTTQDGSSITFVSEDFLQFANNALSVRQGIRWLYGQDSYIISAGSAVLEAAGYADVLAQEDDTEENPSMRR